MSAKTEAPLKSQRRLTLTTAFPQAIAVGSLAWITVIMSIWPSSPDEPGILVGLLGLAAIVFFMGGMIAGLLGERRIRRQRVTFERYLAELARFKVVELVNQPLYDKANAVAVHTLAGDSEARIITVLADNGVTVRSSQNAWPAAAGAAGKVFEGQPWPSYFSINHLGEPATDAPENAVTSLEYKGS